MRPSSARRPPRVSAVGLLASGLLALALSACSGCPGVGGGGAVTTCAKQFEQCRTPAGPLGVCDLDPKCAGGGAACLVCVPQH